MINKFSKFTQEKVSMLRKNNSLLDNYQKISKIFQYKSFSLLPFKLNVRLFQTQTSFKENKIFPINTLIGSVQISFVESPNSKFLENFRFSQYAPACSAEHL